MKCPFYSFLYLLISVILFVGSQRPNFRSDYRFEKAFNAFYKLHFEAEEWPKARMRCEAEGTQLMVPDNLDEADAMPLLTTSILSKYDGVFIGIHDFYSERTFVTLNGSRVLSSILELLWELKEPAYNGGRCVAMRRSGRLFAHPCEKPLPFICKITADRVVYTTDCGTYNLNWSRGLEQNCYIAHTEPQTWYDAYSTCTHGGGHLAVLDDRDEAEYIKQLFKQIEEKRMPKHDFAFLGFSDLFQEHHYRTIFGKRISDGGFSDWELKCSGSKNPASRSLERCGGITRSGLLTTADCTEPAMFFCEKLATKAIARNRPLPLKTNTRLNLRTRF